jgi:hypothetical protein
VRISKRALPQPERPVVHARAAVKAGRAEKTATAMMLTRTIMDTGSELLGRELSDRDARMGMNDRMVSGQGAVL